MHVNDNMLRHDTEVFCMYNNHLILPEDVCPVFTPSLGVHLHSLT